MPGTIMLEFRIETRTDQYGTCYRVVDKERKTAWTVTEQHALELYFMEDRRC